MAIEDTGQIVFTQDQRQRYADCKRQMHGGWSEFARNAEAIRDERLYLIDYKNYEEFCQTELGYTRQYVNKLIKATHLETIGSLENEGQARELLALDDPLEQRVALQLAYSAAAKVIPSGRPTAAMIQVAVATVQEIKETQGKVELDTIIVAAEAKVITRHQERVQEHIDAANAKRDEKSGAVIVLLKGAKCRIVTTEDRKITFEFDSAEMAQKLKTQLESGEGDRLYMKLSRRPPRPSAE